MLEQKTSPSSRVMSSAFCSLDEAFAAPPGNKRKERKEKEKDRERKVPAALQGTPDPDNQLPDAMEAPSVTGTKPEAELPPHEYFPLPGETAAPEEWSRAFMLDASQLPGVLRADGSVPVGGKSTLWRKIPVPEKSVAAVPSHPNQSEIHRRLDALAKQLESLTTASPMQSTAELFLFIAIGLLFLLAIDTLLRYATTIALAKRMTGGFRGRGYGRQRWSR